jgi:hypothetical protein
LRPSRYSLLPLGPAPESPPFVPKTTRFSSCSRSFLVLLFYPYCRRLSFVPGGCPSSTVFLLIQRRRACTSSCPALCRPPLRARQCLCALRCLTAYSSPCRFSSARREETRPPRSYDIAGVYTTLRCAALRFVTVLPEFSPSWPQSSAASALPAGRTSSRYLRPSSRVGRCNFCRDNRSPGKSVLCSLESRAVGCPCFNQGSLRKRRRGRPRITTCPSLPDATDRSAVLTRCMH